MDRIIATVSTRLQESSDDFFKKYLCLTLRPHLSGMPAAPGRREPFGPSRPLAGRGMDRVRLGPRRPRDAVRGGPTGGFAVTDLVFGFRSALQRGFVVTDLVLAFRASR